MNVANIEKLRFFSTFLCARFSKRKLLFYVVQMILNILSINENFPKADSLEDKTSTIFHIVAILLNIPTITIFPPEPLTLEKFS